MPLDAHERDVRLGREELTDSPQRRLVPGASLVVPASKTTGARRPSSARGQQRRWQRWPRRPGGWGASGFSVKLEDRNSSWKKEQDPSGGRQCRRRCACHTRGPSSSTDHRFVMPPGCKYAHPNYGRPCPRHDHFPPEDTLWAQLIDLVNHQLHEVALPLQLQNQESLENGSLLQSELAFRSAALLLWARHAGDASAARRWPPEVCTRVRSPWPIRGPLLENPNKRPCRADQVGVRTPTLTTDGGPCLFRTTEYSSAPSRRSRRTRHPTSGTISTRTSLLRPHCRTARRAPTTARATSTSSPAPSSTSRRPT